jgi:hypothetical protein
VLIHILYILICFILLIQKQNDRLKTIVYNTGILLLQEFLIALLLPLSCYCRAIQRKSAFRLCVNVTCITNAGNLTDAVVLAAVRNGLLRWL